jgi:hypothetical protein
MMEFVNGKDDIPYIVENKKCLKPPTRLCSKSAQMEVIELRRFGVCCCKTNDVGKTIIKPPICEWFIVLPTYDVLRDIGPGDFKHNLMNIYHPKGMSIGPARIWDSGFLPAKSTSCYPLAAGMIVVPKKGCFDQQKPSVLRGLLHGPGMGLKLCTQKNGG